MDEERYLEQILTDFVESAEDKDFIIISDPDDPDQFVQFMRRLERPVSSMCATRQESEADQPFGCSGSTGYQARSCCARSRCWLP
jgi:hypothetical protein